VLSACRSGLGELLRGEGLISLTRSFLYAGSRSVVVSLWDVADSSTADFMLEVYRGLIEGSGTSASLRRAKLSFLTSERPGRRQIRRWAPFVLVGEPGEVTKEMNRDRAGSTP
jgi:CHAT domain-containing protein